MFLCTCSLLSAVIKEVKKKKDDFDDLDTENLIEIFVINLHYKSEQIQNI